MPGNTICIWYDNDAEGAARFYSKVFPDSSISAVRRAPGDFSAGKEGGVLTVEFTVVGVACLGLNGGPAGSQRCMTATTLSVIHATSTDDWTMMNRHDPIVAAT